MAFAISVTPAELEVDSGDVSPIATDAFRQRELDALSPEALMAITRHQVLARDYLPRLFGDDETLTALDLSATGCGDIPITALTDGLACNTILQTLHLDRNGITDAGALLIAEALGVNKTLEYLSLKDNKITESGARAICNAMRKNDNLRKVELEGNLLPADLTTQVAQLTTLNSHPPDFKKSLLALQAGHSGLKIQLGRSDKHAIAEKSNLSSISGIPTLMSMNASSMGTSRGGGASGAVSNGVYNPSVHLDDWCAEQLAKELETNDSVTLLDLTNHCISDRGAIAIANMLRKNRTLDRVVLTGNAITPTGAQAIREALEDNNTLRYVSLYKNLCPDSTIVDIEWHIALNRQPLALKAIVYKMLHNDPSISHVVLDDHRAERFYDDVAARIVADSLSRNTTVTSLAITNSKITEVGARFLADLLAINNTLHFVDLHNNPIGRGGVYIAKALLVNTGVQRLNMSHTEQDDACGLQFAEALETNKTLSELDLSDNPGINNCGDQLSAVSLSNTHLRVLNLLGTRISERILNDIIERQRISREPPKLQEILPSIFDGDPNITAVDLCGKDFHVPLRDNSLKLLSEALEQNFSVSALDVSYNQIGILGMNYLFTMLLENRVTMTSLNLSYNPVNNGAEFGAMLGNVASSHSCLRSIDISDTGLDDEGAHAIIKRLGDARLYSLKELRFDKNPDIAPVLAFKLRMYITFNSLLPEFKERMVEFWNTWEKNDIRLDYDHPLCDFNKYTRRTINVDPVFEYGEYIPSKHDALSSKGRGADKFGSPTANTARTQATYDASLQLLCEALRWTKGFSMIHFADNGISDEGLQHISALVADDAPVTHIDVSGSRITDHGVERLMQAIKKNYRMVSVNIDRCPGVSRACKSELTTVLLYNKQPAEVKELLIRLNRNDQQASLVDFSEAVVNHMTDFQVRLLCLVLAENNVVETIDLSNNHIHLQGLIDLFELAKDHPNIKCIRARNTLIRGGADVGEAVADLLRCSTTIETIDLSYCTLDEDFAPPVVAAVQNNSSLKHLGLRDTGLHANVIAAITNAISLNEQGELKTLVGGIAADTADVTSIISPCAGYNDSNIVELFAALRTNTRVKEIDVSGNYISDKAGREVMALLAENRGIERLTLRDNRIGALSLEELSRSLQRNTTIKHIDLQGNCVPESTARELQHTILPYNSTICRIDIRQQRVPIHSEVVDFYMHGFEINFQLEIKAVIPRLVSNDPTFTAFSVANNPHHNDVGCFHLCDPLMENTTLRTLDLSRGQIGDDGVRHLVKGLFVNRTLQSLDLSFNIIGDEGCRLLGDVIKVNPILKRINLSGNAHISPAGLQNLQRVLVFNDHVEQLDVAGCGRRPAPPNSGDTYPPRGGRSGVDAGEEALELLQRLQEETDAAAAKVDFVAALNNRHLALKRLLRNNGETVTTVVDCSNARQKGKLFDDMACKILCEVLAEDHFVTTINLAGNDLTFESGYTIAALLEKNVTITSIDLSRNTLREGIAQVVRALAKNSSVVSLNVADNGCSPVALERLHLMLQLNREPRSMKKECLHILQQDVTHSLCRISERDMEHTDLISHALGGVGGGGAAGRPGSASSSDGPVSDEDDGGHPSGDASGGGTSRTRQLVAKAGKSRGGGGGVAASGSRKLQADDDSVDLLASLLRTDLIVRDIDLSWNAVTDHGVLALFQLLRRNQSLRSLKLAHNSVTDDGVATACTFIQACPHIVEVDLSFNKITSAVYEQVTAALIGAPQVFTFLLKGNHLSRFQLDSIEFLTSLNGSAASQVRAELCRAFQNDPQQDVIDFNGYASVDMWSPLMTRLACFALHQNTSVTRLSVEFNAIRDEDLPLVCKMLVCNHHLRELSLTGNQLVDVTPLCSTLAKSNTTLKTLALAGNQLSAISARAIASMLRDSDALEELDISNNPWTKAAVGAIQAVISMNGGLQRIYIASHSLPADTIACIEQGTAGAAAAAGIRRSIFKNGY